MGKPLILITSGTIHADIGLRRESVFTGRNYSQAVEAEGGLPLVAPVADPNNAAALVARVDGVLFSGGADIDPGYFDQPPHPQLGAVDPQRDAFELALYRAARAAGKPIFGVCRGIQLINVAAGGSLVQHVPALNGNVQHSQADRSGLPHHRLSLSAGSRIREAFGSEQITVNSYHHQGLDRLGAGLVVTARSQDDLIEAVEGTSGAWLLGVQWHPEMSYATHPEQRAPFRAFLDAVRLQLAA
jgi:putative glutamine amidotransferase